LTKDSAVIRIPPGIEVVMMVRRIPPILLALILVLIPLTNFGCSSKGDTPDLSFVVLITSPSAYDQFPVNGLVPVYVKAYSEKPIQLIELLVDGRKVNQKQATGGAAFFYCRPGSLGTHILTARAEDSAQTSKISAELPVVIAGEAPPPKISYTVNPGDTLAALASKYGVTQEAIQEENPGLGSPAAGQRIFIPTGICKSCQRPSVIQPPLSPELKLINNRLVLPKPIDYGYGYLSFDNVNWQRFPKDEKSFISVANNTLDVSNYIHNDRGQTSSTVYIEAWGWHGGNLVELGKTQAVQSTTALKLCDTRIGCSGDMAAWIQEVTFPKDSKNKNVELFWQTDVSGAKNGLLQISLFPFFNSTAADSVYGKVVAEGRSTVDFDNPFETKKQGPAWTINLGNQSETGKQSPSLAVDLSGILPGKNYGSNFEKSIAVKAQQPGLLQNNFFYYIRVLPVKSDGTMGSPSNTCTVHIVPPEKQEPIKIYSPPKALDVKIKEFRPVHFPEAGTRTGEVQCDTDSVVWLSGSMNPINVSASQTFRPSPFMGIGEKGPFESFCDFVSSGLAWVSGAYDYLKNQVVDAVSGVLCQGNSDCASLVSAGLDAGLVALGLPPDIPNFNDLSEQGLDYLTKEIADQAGCEACADAVKDKLHTLLESRKNIGNAWLDEGTAHGMGIEPFIIISGSGHWYQRAMNYPARVTVDITRSSDPARNEDYDTFKKYYYLRIDFPAVNDTIGSGTLTAIGLNDVQVPYHGPLQGNLFKSVMVPLPPLKPGETITLPINLLRTDYWVPGHKEAMGGWTTIETYDGYVTNSSNWDDWWILYYNAKLNIRASTICYAGTGTPAPLTSDRADNIKIPDSLEVMQAYDSFIYTAK
jgi:LysM repeat protein